MVGGGTNVWQLRTQDWCSSSLQSLLEVIEQWLHPRVMTPTNWRFIYFDNFISMDWRLLPILLAVLCVLDSISVLLPWQIVDCQSSWFTFDSSWLSLDIAPGQVWVIAVKQTLCIYHRISSPGYFHSSCHLRAIWKISIFFTLGSSRSEMEDRGGAFTEMNPDDSSELHTISVSGAVVISFQY